MRISFLIGGLLTIALSVSAQRVPPNTVPPTATKNGSVSKLNATQKTGEADKAGPAESQILPCNQASPCHVIEEPQAKNKEQRANEASLDTLYRRYLWATIIGVVGALAGIGILVWQTMLVKRSADAALSSAEAAKTGAKTAKAQIDAVIAENRPWLLLDRIEVPYLVPAAEAGTGNERFSYCITMTKNHGKTPAKVTTLWASLRIGENPLQPPKDLIAEIDCTASSPEHYIFPPGEIKAAEATLWGGFISPQDRDAILKNKAKFLWLLGFVKYRDTFERETPAEYETRFCYLYETRLNSPQPFWKPAGPPEYNRAT